MTEADAALDGTAVERPVLSVCALESLRRLFDVSGLLDDPAGVHPPPLSGRLVMTKLQRSLPLGSGPVRWDTLPPEVRSKVLELWVRLLELIAAETTDGEGRS